MKVWLKKSHTYIHQPSFGEDGEQGVDVALRREVEPGKGPVFFVGSDPYQKAQLGAPGPDVPARRGDAGGVPGVEAVDGGLLLVLRVVRLDVPLQVGPYLAQERRADALGDRQLLRPRYPVLLREKKNV